MTLVTFLHAVKTYTNKRKYIGQVVNKLRKVMVPEIQTRTTRREFLKYLAAAAAMTAAATIFPGVLFAQEEQQKLLKAYLSERALSQNDIQWEKAPCRFCGVGCGLLIGVAEQKAVAVKGDPDCSVNKWL